MARGSVPGSVPAKVLELARGQVPVKVPGLGLELAPGLVLAWAREQELELVLERVLELVLELAAERIPAKDQIAGRVRMGCRI
jgi:hypothetical protein